jgi:prephenate dehydrogenase
VRQGESGPFERVGIVGLGLIGGSVAMAVRARWPSVRILSFDPRNRPPHPAQRAVVDDVVPALSDLAGTADLILLATPGEAMAPLMGDLAKLKTAAIVTDAGSTKRPVMKAAAECGLASFVGGHPMAGAERPGIAYARADLFNERAWLLVKGAASDHAHVRLQAFVEGLGAKAHWIDANSHDRIVAYISHLPQLLATALMNVAGDEVGEAGAALSGAAFAEMTRLASSPASMWQSILTENADNVSEALRQFAARLPGSADLTGDAWVKATFDRAHEARMRWRERAASLPPRRT